MDLTPTNESTATRTIDNQVESWYNSIKETMDVALLRSNVKQVFQLRRNKEIKAIEHQYTLLVTHSKIYGWTIVEHLRSYKTILRKLDVGEDQCYKEWKK